MRIFIFIPLLLVYIILFNYAYLPNSGSLDIDNYLIAITRFSEYSDYTLSIPAWFYYSLAFWALYEGVSELLFNGNGVLGLLFISILGILLILRGFSSYRNISLVSQLAIIFLILNPRFLDLALSQQRNFLAVAVVITGLLVARRSLLLGLLIIVFSSLIHLSSFLFLCLFLFFRLVKHFKISSGVLILIATLLSILVLSLYVISEQILGRQVLFQQSSYLYVSMWLGVTVFYTINKSSAITAEFAFVYYALILIAFLGMPLGAYSSRLIGLAIPFLALSIHDENIKSGFVFMLILAAWLLSVTYWMKYQIFV